MRCHAHVVIAALVDRATGSLAGHRRPEPMEAAQRLSTVHCPRRDLVALFVDIIIKLSSSRHSGMFHAAVLYQSCVPNTDSSVTMRRTWEQTVACGTMEMRRWQDSARGSRDWKVDSKTCSGLTYLELVLIDIVGL